MERNNVQVAYCEGRVPGRSRTVIVMQYTRLGPGLVAANLAEGKFERVAFSCASRGH